MATGVVGIAIGVAIVTVSPLVCAAGPNEYGTLLLHVDPALVWTEDQSYCGLSGIESCADVTATVDRVEPVVFWVLAAFIEDSSPRLAGVVFGVDYDSEATPILDFGNCGDFELPTSAWPDPGEGTAVTWSSAQQDVIEEVYWFTAYSYSGSPARVDLIPHPTQGAFFADDSVPSQLDPIARMGTLGFFSSGAAPCPAPIGACCLGDGECEELTLEECTAVSGTYRGDGSMCDKDPCPSPSGACCFDDGHCEVLPSDECGDFYQGDGSTCEPHPCDPAGACCDIFGRCFILMDRVCDEGEWLGEGSSCEPNPCEQPSVGACCFSDGECNFILNIDCDRFLGIFHSGVPCDPDPCRGACCFGEECRSDVLEQLCVSEDGEYQGGGVPCDPNPCLTVPSIRHTWGEIKARFRS